MLHFFPQLYPDEIFYSVFARYHKQSGNANIDISSFRLFGRKSKQSIIDLPNDLDFLIAQLPNCTSEEIIYNHTLYRYYSTFVPTERREKILNKMKSGNGTGLSSLIGKVNTLKLRGEHLYYCPKCATYDYNKYGEAYFHRLHQVPGVLICDKHTCELKKYPVKISDVDNRVYHTCDINLVDLGQVDASKESYYSQKLDLAISIKFLLNHNLGDIDIYEVYNRYHRLLGYHGLLRPSGVIKQERLIELLEEYYGVFLETIGCEIDSSKSDNWVNCITRKFKRVLNPLYHILLIQYLIKDISDFFTKSLDITKVNKCKAIDERIIMQQYKKHILCYIESEPYATRENISKELFTEWYYLLENDPYWINSIMPKKLNDRSSPEVLERSKQVLLEFINTYPYCMRTEIRDAHRREYDQCKQYDIKWFNKIMPAPLRGLKFDFDEKRHESRDQIVEYIRNHENCNISEIIRNCRKEYQWLYINDIYWLEDNLPDSVTVNENNRRKMIEQYRERILVFLKSNPDFTRKQIADHLSKEYKYLKMYDREWIDCVTPIPTELGQRNTQKSYIDWEKRDIEVLHILEQTSEINNLCMNTKALTLSKVILLLPIDYRPVFCNSFL